MGFLNAFGSDDDCDDCHHDSDRDKSFEAAVSGGHSDDLDIVDSGRKLTLMVQKGLDEAMRKRNDASELAKEQD